MANTSTNPDGSCNITWQTSKDSSLVYIYANKDHYSYSRSDFVLETKANTVQLNESEVKDAQFIHLVIPDEDTLNLRLVRLTK